MINLVVVVRSNILCVIDSEGNENTSHEVAERLLENSYADNEARLMQYKGSLSEFYFESDVPLGIGNPYDTITEAINDFNEWMYDYDCKMFISNKMPVL